MVSLISPQIHNHRILSISSTHNLAWKLEGIMTHRTKFLALVGACLVVTLAGCTTTDHVYSQGRCLTCINNPITGEPVNYDPDENPVIEEQAVADAHEQARPEVPAGVTGNG